ncbi:ParB/RepB/Spo0J family partition protein [Candidatus Nomurabacteria bacterium]|nr:ParB/RepB/Spo0J family partition protein [Candidatus Nomurabacteria bacterium]
MARYEDSIFWIETDKIHPNPYQPRREFDDKALSELAASIRQYGVLQPLVVSRVELVKEEGGMSTEYELIAGERRLRASRLAGVATVPCVIRVGDDNMAKLELAIIENLQREDLNPVDRARAFLKLQDEFKFTHAQIGDKVGKSRVYVSNTLRLLTLPQDMLDALVRGEISEGHTRPLMMLSDRPEEQTVLFKEIIYKRLSVRDAEKIARSIAKERARKIDHAFDPEIGELENKFAEAFGTRVHIERKKEGGKIEIDYFTKDDLHKILFIVEQAEKRDVNESLYEYEAKLKESNPINDEVVEKDTISEEDLDDRDKNEKNEDDDIYNISNFSL